MDFTVTSFIISSGFAGQKEAPIASKAKWTRQRIRIFRDGTASKPDFLVHQPGTGNNYAVIEVKHSQAVATGIAKDFQTLTRFRNEFGYRRAIYLLWSESGSHSPVG